MRSTALTSCCYSFCTCRWRCLLKVQRSGALLFKWAHLNEKLQCRLFLFNQNLFCAIKLREHGTLRKQLKGQTPVLFHIFFHCCVTVRKLTVVWRASLFYYFFKKGNVISERLHLQQIFLVVGFLGKSLSNFSSGVKNNGSKPKSLLSKQSSGLTV